MNVSLSTQTDAWLLAEPSRDLLLLAEEDAFYLRARHERLEAPRALALFSPTSRAGRLLPTVIAQLLELGVATQEEGSFRIEYREFVTLEERGFDVFESLVPWAPFILEVQSSGSLTHKNFKYFLRFYLGSHPVPLVRRGCFVRRGSTTYRLDSQTFELVAAIEEFNALPEDAKASAHSLLRFERIKGLAESIGAELDAYLNRERVVVPSRLGLDLMIGEDQRITFVPRIDGVPDESMRESFLALDDVDTCYTCTLEGGSRVRVVLTDEQKEVLRRMQRVRHIGGRERADVLRDPMAVFDGVGKAIDVDIVSFGPRVRGIGDFPFVARPYLERSATGIFDDADAPEPIGRSGLSAGIICTYVDGSQEKVQFKSRDEMLMLKAEAEDAYHAGTGHVTFGNKSILVDRSFLQSLNEMVTRLTPKPKPAKEEGQRRFVLIYTNEDEVEYDEELGGTSAGEDAEIPESLLPSVALKDHQRRGLAWLQRNFRMGRRGCLLADDMGLGKTLQTLLFLAWLIEKGQLSENGTPPERAPWNPILIVAPVILLENDVWINDMRCFFKGDGAVFQPWLTLHGKELKAHRTAGTTGSETVIGAAALDLAALSQYRVILTNYETVTNYQHSFARMKDRWTVVVTDEAQEYKTPNTKISHALKSLSPRFRVACTGTPVETRLLDVWNIFDFLQPGKLLGSSTEFSKRYERSLEDATDGGPISQLDQLKRTLRYGSADAFVLRRNKADILTDLAPKHEHRLRCDLSESQRQWHVDLVARARAGGEGNHPLSLIQQLMRMTQHPALVPIYEPVSPDQALGLCPKLTELVAALERIRKKGEKALVFTRSIDMQQLLSSVLQARFDVQAEIVNGATSRHNSNRGGQQTRQAILRRFRESPGFDVLVLSPDVAGLGLTLVEANHVFHYGRWWNPAKESQATDRAYRIGQGKPVHVYYFIAKDPLGQFETFDEKVDALIERRRALAADFLAPMPSEEEMERELLRDVLGANIEGGATLPQLGEEDVRRLSWDRFEALVAALWSKENSDVVLTPKAGDEGVDVIAFKYPTVELVQCKHTLWESAVDADVVAELIQAFDSYRARRFRQLSRSVVFRMTLVTNGKLTASARKAARERDVQFLAATDLLQKLAQRPYTALDVQFMNDRRLASMRDVQARISAFCG